MAGLGADPYGTLFGATTQGGFNYLGALIQYPPGLAESEIHSFGGFDGMTPTGKLVIDSPDNIYGTASAGAGSGYGSVFILNFGRFVTLYSFTGAADGAGPASGVLLRNGNLYGATSGGGANGYGTIYEVNLLSRRDSVV